MITTYLLPVLITNGTEQVAGSELIHDALLLTTENPLERKLIMDTTPLEHSAISALTIEHYPSTQEEQDLYTSTVVIATPSPDTLRAEELLTSSPDVITQPEMWELVRIFGRALGYHFD